MNKLLSGLIFFLPTVCLATDFAATWSIDDIGVNGVIYNQMELDINQGARYYQANGGLIAEDSSVIPLTGTCLATLEGGVACDLQVLQNSYKVELSSDLNGIIQAIGGAGIVIDSADIVFLSVD